MTPQEGENGEEDQEQEGDEIDIYEMAKRWRRNAPEGPSDTDDHLTQPDTKADANGREIDADELVVSYHGRGSIYLPRGLQERLGSDDWRSRTRIPADYDAETHDLTIHFGSLVGDSA